MKKNYQIFVENGKFGLKDPKGFSVLYAVYDEIDFKDESLPIRVKKDGKWGLVDVKGHVLAEPQYAYISELSSRRIAVELDDKWGFIDYSGKLVIPMKYDSVWDFSDPADSFGVSMAFVSKDGKYGAINDVGDVVIPFEYSDIIDSRKGYVIMEKDGQYVVINYRNEILVPFMYDDFYFCADDMVCWSDGVYSVMINIATNEEQRVEYFIMDEFIGDYLVVNKDDKCNIVDRSFKPILSKWYDEIEVLKDWGYVLKDDSTYYSMKSVGSKIVECKSDAFGVYSLDGKTLLLPLYQNKILNVSSGVENLAQLATSSGIGDYLLSYDTTMLKFRDGVTKIGTGWESTDLVTLTKPITIFLPSTLMSVNSDAFIKIADKIRCIYVPAGCGDAIKEILPTHLVSLVKEQERGIAGMVDKFKVWAKGMLVDNKLWETKLCYDLFFLLMFLFVFGFEWLDNTILPFENLKVCLLLFALGVGIISGLGKLIKLIKLHKYGFREGFWAFVMEFGLKFTLTAVTFGTICVVILGANKYLGDEVYEYTDGKVLSLETRGGKTSREVAVIDIPKFNRQYDMNNSNHLFAVGETCVVKYHKGALGLYYIDDVQ